MLTALGRSLLWQDDDEDDDDEEVFGEEGDFDDAACYSDAEEEEEWEEVEAFGVQGVLQSVKGCAPTPVQPSNASAQARAG